MVTRQARIDPDVAAVLDTHEGSLAKAANRVLRDALGLDPKAKTRRRPRQIPGTPVVITEPVPAPDPTVIVVQPERNASVRRPSGRCRHPIGRRIGNRCAGCGATL